MKIAHNAEQFGDNEEILVLKDVAIVGKEGILHFLLHLLPTYKFSFLHINAGLNEDDDELESVHISEASRRKKNAEAAKKKPLYDVHPFCSLLSPSSTILFVREIWTRWAV